MLQRLSRRPRRILMTVDAVGGVWQYALALTQELARRGDAVVLAGLGPLPSDEQRRQAGAFAMLEWLTTPPEWMAEREAQVESLPAELDRLVRLHAPDVLQLNAPSQAVGLDIRCPVVAVSHSCVATWFRAVHGTGAPAGWDWQHARNRRGFDRADITVAPSASHARMLVACYGDISRPEVIHNAVPPVVDHDSRDREDYVLAAGRWWDEGKNAVALEAAAIRAKWPIFAAGPTTRPGSETAAFQSVTSLGPLPNGEVRALMAKCGLFVSPSVYEPFGLAALEAASAGTPLVLADIATYRELWDDAAVFFPPRDAVALADTLNDLAADRRRRDRLGAAALRRSRRLTIGKQADALETIYAQAAAFAGGR